MQIPAFNPQSVTPSSGGGGQLPVSDKDGHPVIIIESEIKETASGDGGFLELTLQVVDGPHQGATGPLRLNLWNNNATAVDIAHRDLSAICHCVGWLQELTDTKCLENKPFRVIVALQDGEEAKSKGYTTVKAFRDVLGNRPGQKSKAPVSSPTAPPMAPPPQQQSPAPLQPMAQQPPPQQWPASPAMPPQQQAYQQPPPQSFPQQGTVPPATPWGKPPGT